MASNSGGRQARSVADNADFLSTALLSGDPSRIDDAVEELLAAYEGYAGQARATARFAFDEVAQMTTPEERDQGVAAALASALVDLEVATVLGQAAVATEEGTARADLDEAVATLNQTIQALERPVAVSPGVTRFGFDEVVAAEAAAPVASPDLPTARAAFAAQARAIYDALLAETTGLLVSTFEEVSGLDAARVREGLQAVAAPLQTPAISGLVQRALDAVSRAVATLRDILGPENVGAIEERVSRTLDEIRQGQSALQLFLKYSFDYEGGQQQVEEWLKAAEIDKETLDEGTRLLRELYQQVRQAFALETRIIGTLNQLRRPLDWALKRVGGTLPLDLLMGGVFVLVLDIALLRAMDYADTTRIFRFVDGVILTSRRLLGVEGGA
jgi:hypothetical protein